MVKAAHSAMIRWRAFLKQVSREKLITTIVGIYLRCVDPRKSWPRYGSIANATLSRWIIGNARIKKSSRVGRVSGDHHLLHVRRVLPDAAQIQAK